MVTHLYCTNWLIVSKSCNLAQSLILQPIYQSIIWRNPTPHPPPPGFLILDLDLLSSYIRKKKKEKENFVMLTTKLLYSPLIIIFHYPFLIGIPKTQMNEEMPADQTLKNPSYQILTRIFKSFTKIYQSILWLLILIIKSFRFGFILLVRYSPYANMNNKKKRN